MHPEKHFPHRSLLLIGGLAILASFLSLEEVIAALMAARILIQFIGHTLALFLLRKEGRIEFPFRMWFYPLPALISLAGYTYVFLSLGMRYLIFGIGTLVVGGLVYLVAAKGSREWPFQEG
ncbi:MAG: hypothetical protein R2724_21750 [Bryobacterales bacterium]